MRVGTGIRGQSPDGWRLAAAPRSCLAAQPSLYLALGRRSVAQPGRALLSGGRGRRFKSSHSDQIFSRKSVAIGRFSRWRCAAAKSGTLREPAAYIGTSLTHAMLSPPPVRSCRARRSGGDFRSGVSRTDPGGAQSPRAEPGRCCACARHQPLRLCEIRNPHVPPTPPDRGFCRACRRRFPRAAVRRRGEIGVSSRHRRSRAAVLPARRRPAARGRLSRAQRRLGRRRGVADLISERPQIGLRQRQLRT